MFIFWILFSGACNTTHHALTKLLPKLQHPFVSLAVSYLLASAVTFLLCVCMSGIECVGAAFCSLNIYSALIGLALVGIEAALFYLYQLNSPLSTTHLMISIAETAFNVGLGIVLFGESLSAANIIGLTLAILGTFLVAYHPQKK